VIEPMDLPSVEAVNLQRLSKLEVRVTEILGNAELAMALGPFKEMIERYQRANQATQVDVAAALAYMAQGETPLMSEDSLAKSRSNERAGDRGSERGPDRGFDRRPERGDDRGSFRGAEPRFAKREFTPRPRGAPEAGMQTFRIEVGHQHGVKPANIVGAIANEADLGGKLIGRIEIFDDHSLVDLPVGMPPQTFQKLQLARVAGQMLRIRPADSAAPDMPIKPRPHFDKPGKKPFAKRPRPANDR
jgi:ATP-dependent RNA helicase DeaD